LQIKNGATVLLLSRDKLCLGRIYSHPSMGIIQPLDSAAEPVFISPKMRKNRDVKLFKITEIRKRF
jgi:tRNA G26 N,N-dimethylase Trm1